jgi:putative endonuclease
VDAAKQRRLTRLAQAYLHKHRLERCAARFDVVTVHWPQGQSEPDVRHFVGAFDAAGRG